MIIRNKNILVIFLTKSLPWIYNEIVRSLYLILILAFFFLPSAYSSDAKSSTTTDTCVSLISASEAKSLEASRSDYKNEQKERVQYKLQNFPRKDFLYKVGDKLNVFDKYLVVEEILGAGAQAIVYKVRDTHSTIYSLKVFRNIGVGFDLIHTQAEIDFKHMHKLVDLLGESFVVKPIDLDKKRGMILSPYVHGTPIVSITDQNLLNNLKPLLDFINHNLRAALFPVHSGSSPNIIVTIPDGKLMIIDAT